VEKIKSYSKVVAFAKNAAAYYKGVKINIVDTPGHADFGGEVERVLKMVNGVILLVDAAEGPMPQTRFVLSKALELGHKIIVVINKIDRPDARLDEVGEEVLELLLDLDASDEQLDSPVLFCSGRDGTASAAPFTPGKDLSVLFDMIVDYLPAPEGESEDDFQMLISSIDYSEYVGRMAIGRIERGSLSLNQEVAVCDFHDKSVSGKGKVGAIYQIDGTGRVAVEKASVGDIVCVSGLENITIGNTLTATTNPEPIEFVKIGEPTVEMTFSVNDSPFAGKEGKFVTSRQLRDRLYRELLKDVSLRVRDGETTDNFIVSGRGEMHLSILIETMRREGYEFAVSTPRVLFKEIDGALHEPMEKLFVDVPYRHRCLRSCEWLDLHPAGRSNTSLWECAPKWDPAGTPAGRGADEACPPAGKARWQRCHPWRSKCGLHPAQGRSHCGSGPPGRRIFSPGRCSGQSFLRR